MLKALSLFTGAGGMDIGFQSQGFNVVAGIELDPSCCETLRTNMGIPIIEGDIRDIDGVELLNELKLKVGELDLVFGGPPCQPFSLAGNRKGLDDTRGQLVGEFIRIVKELKPKSFVLENVSGMVSWSKGQVIQMIVDEFKGNMLFDKKHISYKVTHKVLDASNYGVPQHRKRLFIVGNRLGKSFEFPKPTHSKNSDSDGRSKCSVIKPFVTVGDALEGLPAVDKPSQAAIRVSQTIKDRRKRHGY